MANNKKNKSKQETFKVRGEPHFAKASRGKQLIGKVKDLIKEGNVRSIIIKDKLGKPLVQLPLTIGVFGAVIAPLLAAVGAIAALVAECTITVEREKEQ